VIVREAKNDEAALLKNLVSILIRFRLKRVHFAVDLDDEVGFETDEVDNESLQDMLSTKVKASPVCAKSLPEQRLRTRHLAPQITRARTLHLAHARTFHRRLMSHFPSRPKNTSVRRTEIRKASLPNRVEPDGHFSSGGASEGERFGEGA
jgi:hypothetical protein